SSTGSSAELVAPMSTGMVRVGVSTSEAVLSSGAISSAVAGRLAISGSSAGGGGSGKTRSGSAAAGGGALSAGVSGKSLNRLSSSARRKAERNRKRRQSGWSAGSLSARRSAPKR